MSAGRFAPSPTGELHLGNLRTALLAWLFARSTGRSLLLRIEDLDVQRCRPEWEQSQRDDLAALGLSFDPPELRQSERTGVYAAALASLSARTTASGRPLTFECFCSRREIAEATSAPHGTPQHPPYRASQHPPYRAPQHPPYRAPQRYPGTCRDLSEQERDVRRRDRPAAIRLRADGATQRVHDQLAGDLEAEVDDLVLRRNDGAYAYHLAVVVDDLDSGIDQVVRGDDLLDIAPSQAYLTRLLGGTVPTYAHVPLVLGPSGARLAKRDGAVTLRDLAAAGVGADQVLGLIAVSLGLAEPGEPVDPAGLAARFDPGSLPRAPWTFAPAAPAG